MALIDFLETVGHKVLGSLSSASSQAPATSAAPTSGADDQNTQKLTQFLQSLNLGIQNPSVSMQGDKVTLNGQAPSQAVMEKAILAVGNVQGVKQVDAQITAPQAQEPKFYTVKSGDTLSKIAKEQTGHANDYMKIFEANKPLLKDPNDIYPGQKLRIPTDAETTSAAA